MRTTAGSVGMLVLGLLAVASCGPSDPPSTSPAPIGPLHPLPDPMVPDRGSVEAAIAERRSVRGFDGHPLSDAEVGQLLWAAQGITGPDGERAAPSAGATYPLEVYVATAEGVAHYRVAEHALDDHREGDLRAALAEAALGQGWIADAPLVVAITGVLERLEARYDERAERYLLLEAGHAAQNVLLQATTLELVGVPVGAFDDDAVRAVLELPADRQPLYLLPVGAPAG